jgi:hypothetical protein
MRRTLMLLSTKALALLLASGLALVALSPAARADGDCQPSGSQVVCTFNFTGNAQHWTVPEGVTQATFDVYGAQGGNEPSSRVGGRGGKASATIAVTPGERLQVNVGGRGSDGVAGNSAGGAGGFNGGAAGGSGFPSGGGGGGASDVRSGAFGLANRIIVGGGGGGAGGGDCASCGAIGGSGGGVTGGGGETVFGSTSGGGGGGGTDSKGGDGGVGNPSSWNGVTGDSGTGGSGGSGGSGGGGGGGGYYGGGGGGAGSLAGGGGGGGSGFGPSGVVFQSGVRSGNGLVTITYTEPVAYTVDRSDDPDLSITPTAGNCTAAANDCSLRGAITAANSSSGAADTIVFDLDSPATITLASSLGQLPSITDAPPGLTIDGGDAEITVSGGGEVRVFAVGNGAELALENLTVSGGFAAGEDPIDERGGGAANFGGTLTISNSTFSGNSAGGTSSGGGVYTTDGGTVNVTDSTFSGNSAVFGGGIYNQNSSTTVTNSTFSDNSAAFGGGGGGINNDNRSTLTVTNSTFSGNSGGAGGGIANDGAVTVNNSTFSSNSAFNGGGIGNFGTLTVNNSTFSGNSADDVGGGIANLSGTATLKNTIVAKANNSTGGDCGGTVPITDDGYNLSSDDTCDFSQANNSQSGTVEEPLDPKLGSLADNGGPTLTHALLAGSPAVDKGNTDLTDDQRGQPRPFDDPNVAPATGGDNSDIGSFEVQEVLNTAPDAKDDSATTSEDDSVTINVLANDADPDGDTLTVGSVTQPTNGSAALNADNTVTYTPKSDFNGKDTFTYTISDANGETTTATVTVTVNSVNDAPVANADSATTDEDTATAIAVLANDTDVEGESLSVSSFTQPAHGTVTKNADGTLKYTPEGNYNSSDSFTYKANDGTADSGVATVSISVTAVNDAPTIDVVGGSQSTCLSNTRARTTLKLTDVDSSTTNLTLSATSSSNTSLLPKNNVTFAASTDSTRTATITTLSGRTGSSTVTITISEDEQPVGSVPVTVKVGGNGRDTLSGTGDADILLGQNGDDTLRGHAKSDVLCGANGNDRLTGDDGADHFGGGSGTDTATDFTAGVDTRSSIP